MLGSTRTPAASRAVATALLLGACGGGDGPPTGPPEPPGGDRIVLERVSGDGQTAGTDGRLPERLEVRVRREDGALVVGHAVAWRIASAAGPGAAVVEADAASDTRGVAGASVRLGGEPGAYRVEASVQEGASVAFTATAEARRPAALERVSGDGQTAPAGEPLADSLVVRALDQFGDPIAGADVAFAIYRGAEGEPALSPSGGTSDAAGRAATSLRVGVLSGTYGVRASAGGDSVAFTARAEGGEAPLLALEDVTPGPLEAGGEAVLSGRGFSPRAGENDVRVDGRAASVLEASPTTLRIEVPTYEDECLPRRDVAVSVVFEPDTASPLTRELVPALGETALAPGEQLVLSGPEEVGCLLLPPAGGGEAYEVQAVSLPDAVGTAVMQLAVDGSPAPAGEAAGPAGGLATEGALGSPAAGEAGRDGHRPPELRGPSRDNPVQHAWDRRMRALDRRLGGLGLEPSRRDARLVAQQVPAVGDSADFTASCTSSGNEFRDVRAVVRSVSEHAVVYEDTVAANDADRFSDARYDSIAASFDDPIFATDTAYFGPPADVDDNGRVVLLFTPAVNALTTGSYDEGFVAGYFCSLDLQAGNEGEIFYLVVPDPDGEFNGGGGSLPTGGLRGVIEGTVAHEFQHLINAQTGGGAALATWINEGLSHLAEEAVGHAVSGLEPGAQITAAEITADERAWRQFYRSNFVNLLQYLRDPAGGVGPITAGDPGVPGTFRMRGTSWLFLRYLLDRFEEPASETDFTRSLIARSGDERAAVSSLAGVPFERLMADWTAMLALEDREDLGGAPPASAELASYRLRELYRGITTAGEYPLVPDEVGLAESTVTPATLETSASRYLTLRGTAASRGTGVRLEGPGGALLTEGTAPWLVVTRVR